MINHSPTCIYCEQSDQNIPLISFQLQGIQHWICPQHLPILIHQPARLADKLPDLERITPAEGQA